MALECLEPLGGRQVEHPLDERAVDGLRFARCPHSSFHLLGSHLRPSYVGRLDGRKCDARLLEACEWHLARRPVLDPSRGVQAVSRA